ncbi:hypothetical protein C9I50_03505 [Pseudomonas prosekii]|nr:hypothetical protein C9I50_03505 [Pseudomonas prosekii]
MGDEKWDCGIGGGIVGGYWGAIAGKPCSHREVWGVFGGDQVVCQDAFAGKPRSYKSKIKSRSAVLFTTQQAER